MIQSIQNAQFRKQMHVIYGFMHTEIVLKCIIKINTKLSILFIFRDRIKELGCHIQRISNIFSILVLKF